MGLEHWERIPTGQLLTVMSLDRWIASKVTEILANEDDVVIELVFNLLESGRYVRADNYDYQVSCDNMILTIR